MATPPIMPATNPPLFHKLVRAQVAGDLSTCNIDLADSGWNFLATRYLRLVTRYIISALIEFVLVIGITLLLFAWIAPANQLPGFYVLLLLAVFNFKGAARKLRLPFLVRWHATRQITPADESAQP